LRSRCVDDGPIAGTLLKQRINDAWSKYVTHRRRVRHYMQKHRWAQHDSDWRIIDALQADDSQVLGFDEEHLSQRHSAVASTHATS
jgi:hypothetical protein